MSQSEMQQQTNGRGMWARRRVAWFPLIALLALQSIAAIRVAGEETESGASSQNTGASAGSITGRAGYLAFETFGRNDSITHVEIMPYLSADQHTVFSDVRFFMSNDGYFGGNVGFGYRYRIPEGNRFLGASLWYDLDDTTSEMFHQLGVSLESCGSLWDVRANMYFPIGDFEKDYSITVGNQQFVGNQISYTGIRRFGEAMKGYDLEISLPIPTELAREHNVCITPGNYMFFGDAVDDIYGYKVRIEGNITPNVAMQVEMTDDDTFGTTVMAGIEFVLPGGSRLEDPGDTASLIRTDQFVHRNYNVIVSKQSDLRPGMTAINPDTGSPYTIQHVSSTGTGSGAGTVEDPFDTVAAAQAAGGDIIFVHGGSVLSDPIVMQAGEQILGEGIDYQIEYAGHGTALLPTVNASTTRPTLLGTSGTAVTLASDSRLAGFIIDSPTAYGILGDTVENVLVHDINVVNSGLDGLYLHDVGGENTFYNLAITGTGGAGILIDGGAGEHEFTDTAVGSATGAGVDIRNTTGTYAFDTLDVTNQSGGAAVSIVDSTAEGSFESLNIETDGATGLYVRNGGEIEIESGDIDAENAAAIDIEDATVDANLTSVSSTNSTFGIRIVDHEGEFLIVGNSSESTGGLIQNATTGVLLVNAGTVGLQYVDIDACGVGVDATSVELLALSYANVTDCTSFGLDALNVEVGEIVGSVFDGNGGASENSIRFRANTQGDYGLFLSGNTITDSTAAAVALSTSSSGDGSTLTLQISDSEITTSRLGAAGVLVDWNGVIVGSILDNAFEATGGSNTGIDITTTSTSDLAEFAIVRNTFAFDGGDDVGIRIVTAGASTLSIGTNTIDFDASGGTGMDFDLAASTDIYVYYNTITDNVSGGTGIQFTSITGSSTVTLQKNTIDLLSTTSVIDRGIIFTSVTDTVELVNGMNNTVTGATTAFYAPVGSLDGYTYVNGETVP